MLFVRVNYQNFLHTNTDSNNFLRDSYNSIARLTLREEIPDAEVALICSNLLEELNNVMLGPPEGSYSVFTRDITKCPGQQNVNMYSSMKGLLILQEQIHINTILM